MFESVSHLFWLPLPCERTSELISDRSFSIGVSSDSRNILSDSET